MRPFALALFALILGAATCRTSTPRDLNSACRLPDSLIVPARLAYLKHLMSSSDPEYRRARDSVGLAFQRAAAVRLETRGAACQDGVNALNILLESPGKARQIWLFRLGTGYAVHDPDAPSVAGQPEPLYIFSSRFSYISTLMVF
jgi:hypothetical protein